MSEEKHADGNGWNKYEKLVLSEITRIAKNTEDIRDATEKSNMQFVNLISQVELRVLHKMSLINREIAALQVKAGIWGCAAAIATVLVALGIFIVQQAWAAPH